MNALDVLAVGEAMAMVTPDPTAALEQATTFRLDVGGAESNVVSHLAAEGLAAAWAGAVGDDALGRRLLATLRERGVDTSLACVDPHSPTGVYLKDPSPSGTRVLYYRKGSAASRLGRAFAAGLPLRTARLVHLSGVTAALSDTCRDLLDEVIAVRRSVGLPVSFDVNYRSGLWSLAEAASELLALARVCDLVFVGLDEAQALWGTETPAQVVAVLGGASGRALDSARVIVKDGPVAHGFRGGESITVAAPQVAVVEPVGAGDAFAAGFVAAWLAGDDGAVALARGHRVAARVLASPTDYPVPGGTGVCPSPAADGPVRE